MTILGVCTVMDTHITSGGHIQTLDKVIHYLAEFFQYAVHYIFANFKMMSNTCKKTDIFLTEICMRLLDNNLLCINVEDDIWKSFKQVVNTLIKGFASGLH